MPEPEDGTRIVSPAEFRRLIVQLGITMVAAGDAVDVIEGSLRRIVAAYGVAGLQIALLLTSLFVQTGEGDNAHVQFSSQVVPPLRLDQIDGLYRLVRQFERAGLTVSEGRRELGAVYRRQPTFRWPLRTAGHAVLTVGLVLLLQPTPGGIAAAFALGMLIGVLKLVRLPTLTLIFPIMASFLTAAVVFGSASYLHVDNPIRLLVAPLVTFLPAFWLLVPGATGLIGVTQIVGTGFDVTSRALSDVLITIISISLGVLIGAAAHHTADAGLGRLSGDRSVPMRQAPASGRSGRAGLRPWELTGGTDDGDLDALCQ